MKLFLRSVQTHLPFLHDLRFKCKFLWMRLSKKPHDPDFEAIKLFSSFENEDFVDIGSNRGEAILSMLLVSKKQNKIVGFEPNPIVFKKLFKRFSDNDRVHLHNLGLSEKASKRTLFIPFYRRWMFDGLASFHHHEASDWLKTRMWRFDQKLLTIESVPCTSETLGYFKLKPCFVKIDVQGSEMEVLQGGG